MAKANGGTVTKDSWKRYDLHQGIKNFIDAMKRDEAYLTAEQKQKIVNLGWGVHFDGFKQTANEYSSTVAPWFMAHTDNLTEAQKEAVREFNLVNDICYRNGANLGDDPYGLDGSQMKEIAECFSEAERGNFRKPAWCPSYIDNIDKMKAIVFAHLEDINYSEEAKLLERSLDDFTELAKMWDGDFDAAMEFLKQKNESFKDAE